MSGRLSGRSSNKEVAALIDVLKGQGWRVTRAKRASKYLLWSPDGEGRPIPVHETPSDARWRRNLVGQLRRAGAEVD